MADTVAPQNVGTPPVSLFGESVPSFSIPPIQRLSLVVDQQIIATSEFVPTQLLSELRTQLGLSNNVRFVFEEVAIEPGAEEQEITVQDIIPADSFVLTLTRLTPVKMPHPKAVFLKEVDGLKLYRFPQFTSQRVPKSRFRETVSRHSLKDAKFMLLLGESGGGKSTLINALANHWLGVEFQDPYRYILVDEPVVQETGTSVTSEVNMYILDGSEDRPQLVLIDTPGYGDTAGIGRDQKTDQMLEELFGDELDVLHMICLVAKASTVRFTETQNYIYNKMLRWFDDEFLSSFMCLFTFSDQGTPQVIKELQSSGSPLAPMIRLNKDTQWYVKINNSSLYEPPSDDTFVKLWWDFTTHGLSVLASRLMKSEAKSLTQLKSGLLLRAELKKKVSATSAYLMHLCKCKYTIKQISNGLKVHAQDKLREVNFKVSVEEGLFEHEFPPKTLVRVFVYLDRY